MRSTEGEARGPPTVGQGGVGVTRPKPPPEDERPLQCSGTWPHGAQGQDHWPLHKSPVPVRALTLSTAESTKVLRGAWPWLWTPGPLVKRPLPADAWSVIASPFLPKYLSSPRCAALQGALYLIGDNTKKVYVYDPGANLWQKVGSPGLPGPSPLVGPAGGLAQ